MENDMYTVHSAIRASAFALALVVAALWQPASGTALESECVAQTQHVAAAEVFTLTQMQLAQTPRREAQPRPTSPAAGNLKAAPSSPPVVALIKEGACCSKVLGGCATICAKKGGCTGNQDCVTNPN
jgi:hypothetical protein